jgi:hypothetical protein
MEHIHVIDISDGNPDDFRIERSDSIFQKRGKSSSGKAEIKHTDFMPLDLCSVGDIAQAKRWSGEKIIL